MGETSTTWKKGQSGNPKGRPKGTVAEKLAASPVAKALGLTPQELPAYPELGSQPDSGQSDSKPAESLTPLPAASESAVKPRKLSDAEIREGLRALMPAALLCMERELRQGGDKAGTAARYIMDQVVGKATETVKHSGEGPGWVIEWKRRGKAPEIETKH